MRNGGVKFVRNGRVKEAAVNSTLQFLSELRLSLNFLPELYVNTHISSFNVSWRCGLRLSDKLV